jgi:hypothetical protein
VYKLTSSNFALYKQNILNHYIYFLQNCVSNKLHDLYFGHCNFFDVPSLLFIDLWLSGFYFLGKCLLVQLLFGMMMTCFLLFIFFMQIPNGAAGHYLLGLIYRSLLFFLVK